MRHFLVRSRLRSKSYQWLVPNIREVLNSLVSSACELRTGENIATLQEPVCCFRVEVAVNQSRTASTIITGAYGELRMNFHLLWCAHKWIVSSFLVKFECFVFVKLWPSISSLTIWDGICEMSKIGFHFLACYMNNVFKISLAVVRFFSFVETIFWMADCTIEYKCEDFMFQWKFITTSVCHRVQQWVKFNLRFAR